MASLSAFFFRTQLLMLALMALMGPILVGADEADINSFIYGLQYDKHVLLSVAEPGSTQSFPDRDDSSGDAVIICTNTPWDLSMNFSEITLLSPTAGVAYPGALLKANSDLANDQPDAIALPRSEATFSIDLPGPGAQSQFTVVSPTNSSVTREIQKVLEDWNQKSAPQGYVNPVRSTYNIQKAYNSTQLALDLGFSAKWAGNQFSSQLNVKTSNKSSLTVAMYKQVFYTVSMDAPPEPASVFAPSVTLEQIKNQVDEKNPPGWVVSMDYGRIILVRMQTSEAATQTDLEGAMDYVTSGATQIHGDTQSKLERIAENSTFTVITLGGNAEVASQLVADYTQVPNVIQENATYSRSNPGYPIAYRVVFLKDNSPAVMAFTTDYNESECVRHPNGFVKLSQTGGYVGRWFVKWTSAGKSQEYKSGNKTSPLKKTVDLPGDAKNVQILAQAMTGLVWDSWREAINVHLNGPTNKFYKIYGTTLSPSWNNNC